MVAFAGIDIGNGTIEVGDSLHWNSHCQGG
jgi:hypothetical protein